MGKYLSLIIFWGILISANSANAALILNRPTYTGLNNGLVGYWSFDGKDVAGFPSTATRPGTVYDRSGQGNNGLYYNATGTQPVEGKLGQALEFDGINNYIDIGNVSSLQITNDITVTAWIKIQSGSNERRIISKWHDTPTNQFSYLLNISAANNLEFATHNDIGEFMDSLSNTVLQNNTWYHVVGMFQSGTAKVFVNGIQDGTQPSASNSSITNSSARVIIGSSDDSVTPGPFPGLIDDVRVYNRALSVDEIKRLYRIGGTLHVNSGDLGKNDTLQKGLVGHWTFDGKDIAGFPSTATTPGTVYDKSGQGNNGLYYNATGTQPVEGKIGQALNFDGSNDFVDAGDINAIDGLTKLSVSGWFKINSFPDFIHMLDKRNGNDGWDLQTGGSGTGNPQSPLVLIKDGAATNYGNVIAAVLKTNTWHHIVFVYDGTEADNDGRLKIFIDGANQGPLNFFGTIPASMTAVNANLVIARPSSDMSDSHFPGTADDVRIYNRALSADEVKRLYRIGGTLHVNSGDLGKNDTLQKGLVGHWTFDGKDVASNGTVLTVYDRSGYGNNGTTTSASLTPKRTEGKIGQALDFYYNNTASAIDAGSNAVLDDMSIFSISAWINPRSFGKPGGTKGRIVDKRSNPNGWTFQADFDTCLSGLGLASPFDTTAGSFCARNSIVLNQWQHIVLTYDRTSGNNDPKIFVNGISMPITVDIRPEGTFVTDAESELLIGNNAPTGSDRSFDGLIDDVRIYNRALTADEIKRLYNLGR